MRIEITFDVDAVDQPSLEIAGILAELSDRFADEGLPDSLPMTLTFVDSNGNTCGGLRIANEAAQAEAGEHLESV